MVAEIKVQRDPVIHKETVAGTDVDSEMAVIRKLCIPTPAIRYRALLKA